MKRVYFYFLFTKIVPYTGWKREPYWRGLATSPLLGCIYHDSKKVKIFTDGISVAALTTNYNYGYNIDRWSSISRKPLYGTDSFASSTRTWQFFLYLFNFSNYSPYNNSMKFNLIMLLFFCIVLVNKLQAHTLL